ncbi:putative aminotransferase [Aurantimonas manganoxydans SI85-9A1]|uniref:Probable aminotransferase n=2 Tax=Aurantimonas manganoxydans TaxID=651183 RepID=A0A0N7KYC9_9HYPH|nr:cysteine desulfurase-like protein [Aurantimonas manganoxydans]EAS50143.1 putative aminotransferase [Aurantimonas manganoxydans SI85-9A1]BAT29369.1 probable aminotransferase [Aurantimonas manganoxydans SI85-9A1]
MALDMDFVRRQFPALSGDWVFMDNAGGSQVLSRVADRISDYLLTSNVQTGATYAPSQRSTERVREARNAFARYLNAADAGEIVMGASTTMLIRVLSEAMTGSLSAGDEIIVTNTDHEANIGPWLKHEARGVVVRFWNCDPETLELDLDDLKDLMSERTKLVCVTHASNIFGTINPIAEISQIAHASGAQVCVDGVAYAPHRAVDVQALGADYYIFSAYKVFGPHVGVMWGRRDRLLELDNIYHFFFGKDAVPHKLEPGNINYELAHGAVGAIDYVEELGVMADATAGRGAIEAGFRDIAEQERAITARLLDFLGSRNSIRIVGRNSSAVEDRVATISFIAGDRDSKAIVDQVDPHMIGIRHGDFYAKRLILDLGLAPQNGVVRVSMVHYNTLDEVDRLIAALEPAL